MWKPLSGILLVGMLVACNQSTASEQPKEERKIEVKQEEQKPSINTDKEDLKAYSNEMYPLINNIVNDLTDITTLSELGASNTNILLSDEYINEVQAVCDRMKQDIQAVRSVDIRGNQKVNNIQSKILQAMNEIEYVADNLPSAISVLDSDTINECANAMSRGSDLFIEASQQVVTQVGKL